MRNRIGLLLLTGLFLMRSLFLAGPIMAQTAGAAFFHRGQYTEAYAALWPELNAGNPEAIFYALVIRRNGLDGRASAAPGEFASLWRLLAGQAERMRTDLRDRGLSNETHWAYRTALAQLEYFGPALSYWPPPAHDLERVKRAHLATGHLSATSQHFTPALNFQAFLDHDAYSGRHASAFNRTLKAAEKGDRLAMGNLAWFYRQGLGTDKNDLRAAYWAHKGCQSVPGISRNQNEMGYLYESGRGVSLDLHEAARWYELSAAQGHPAGLGNAERLKKKRAGEPMLDNRVLF